ncbi:MAG TPA: N-6 DNA methylase [Flavisolibacter sp.]|nr:N-6 DNA methylase [Flavisolibacter sp.]
MEEILDFTNANGLVLCAEPQNAQNNSEILYLAEAQKLGVKAVFFRRYYNDEDTKPFRSEPAVCIFEENDNFFNSDEHIKLHAAIWSASKNEVYIIKSPTRTDIINARKPAEASKNGNLSIENLLLASSAAVKGIDFKNFSAYLFGSGTFWEQPEFEKTLNEKNSPYLFLLDYLMAARKRFLTTGSIKLSAETIDKLLVISILIKFLEEITDDDGKHTLRTIYKKYRISTFSEAVERNLCVAILNELSNEFNGKIFDKFSEEEKDRINGANLTILSNFLSANIDIRTNQIFFWEQYSFKHLPAEVISAIYENFIQAEAVREHGEREKGVVYTPIHLVNLLIDELMPLDRPDLFRNNTFRVLDPACGSGVFLVAAFKRMLQWWALNHSTRENIKFPDSKTAQKILEDNIFGVDVKKAATLISVFSLTTALLDKLTPQEIWNKLKFKDLSKKNIQNRNFFEWAVSIKKSGETFNLIIGNPPFNLERGKKLKDVLSEEIFSQLDFNHKKLPDNNFALHFLEAAMLFAPKVSLIIPANVLLYNKAANEYRRQIFTRYNIYKIFDFTHLRRDLFHKTADVPIVAVICNNQTAKQNFIDHVVVKRTIISEKRLRFEIDYYDRHKVMLDWATDESKDFIWKTNLLGGGRLFQLIYRLSLLPNLEQFITEKRALNDEWTYEVGYEAGNAKEKKVVHYIHGQDKITGIDENGKLISNTIEKNKYFYRPKNESLFTLPLLVIHKKIGENFLPVGIKSKHPKPYLVFNSSFVGIHAPNSEFAELKQLYDRFKQNIETYLLWILNNSSSAMISQETAIKKTDLDTLPFPSSENEQYLKLTSPERIIREDVLNYYIHLGKSISDRSAGRVLHDKVSGKQLKEFGETFCTALNEIYSRNDKSWQVGSVSQSNLYTIYQFGYGKSGRLSYKFNHIGDDALKSLIEEENANKGVLYTRILRIYKHLENYDCIFFIKPNAQRYWLNSIALRDADDTFIDLKKAGF